MTKERNELLVQIVDSINEYFNKGHFKIGIILTMILMSIIICLSVSYSSYQSYKTRKDNEELRIMINDMKAMDSLMRDTFMKKVKGIYLY